MVQSVLLYGSETWVITPQVLQVLGSFHNRVARRISRRMPRLQANGVWFYPPIAEALSEAGLFPIEHYVQKRQRTLVDTPPAPSLGFVWRPLGSLVHHKGVGGGVGLINRLTLERKKK